jgi:4-hydroxybenzoate polyprenyltransferase
MARKSTPIRVSSVDGSAEASARIGGRTLAALLRCGSCRFAAIYFLPFYGALAGAQNARPRWVMLGVVFWFLHSLGTEVVNRLSDREEDEINRPERTALCRQVGYENLRRVAVGTWAAVAAVDVVFLIIRPSAMLGVLLVLGALASINYSYGLRLARNRYASLVVMTFPFGGTFLIGWALAHGEFDSLAVQDLFFHAGPLLLLGGLSIGTLAGVKDITDVKGDAKIGYRSAWLSLVYDHTAWVALVLACIPSVALGLLVAGRALPVRFLLLFLFLPAVVVLAQCVLRASSDVERLATREFFYHYWIAYIAVAIWLYAPWPGTIVAIALTLAYWVLATQFLHWSNGINKAMVLALRSLIFRTAGSYAGDRRVEGTGPMTRSGSRGRRDE